MKWFLNYAEGNFTIQKTENSSGEKAMQDPLTASRGGIHDDVRITGKFGASDSGLRDCYQCDKEQL